MSRVLGAFGLGLMALGIGACGFSSSRLRPEFSRPGAAAYEITCKSAVGCASEANDVCGNGYTVLSAGDEYRPDGLDLTLDILGLMNDEEAVERDARQERNESHVMIIRCEPQATHWSADADPDLDLGERRAAGDQGGRSIAELPGRQVARTDVRRRETAEQRKTKRRAGTLTLRDGLIGKDGALASEPSR